VNYREWRYIEEKENVKKQREKDFNVRYWNYSVRSIRDWSRFLTV